MVATPGNSCLPVQGQLLILSFSLCHHAGVTAALAHIFKAGLRQHLLPVLPTLWPAAMQLPAAPVTATNALARKLTVKLVQRLGLALLPPQTAAWAHAPAVVSLADTLYGGGSAAAAAAATSSMPLNGTAAVFEGNGHASMNGDQDSIEGVPEEVEEVIQVLLPTWVLQHG